MSESIIIPAAVVTTADLRDPEWDSIRETAGQLKAVGRLWLRGQVRLGMQLAAMKKQLGIRAGQPKKNLPESGKFLPWADLVKQETGYSRQSCDEFIRLYDATVLKLKKAKKLELPDEVKKNALAIFQDTSALALTPEQWEIVEHVIGTLTTGETQSSLMQEIGLIPKPPRMPKGGNKGDEDSADQEEEETAGQLAFIFFGTVASPLINARTNPDYRAMLLALPVHGDSENPLCLSSLAAEFRAALADVEEAISSTAKPTAGREVTN